MDRDELRKLAEAAKASIEDEPWWTAEGLLRTPTFWGQDAAFIAAASPDVVMGLLDERDEAREAVWRLAGVLMNIQGNARQDAVQWDCESALADPVVRRIVEGG